MVVPLVAHVGQANGLLQVRDSVFLANPDLMEFLITDQRIGYVSESSLNGLAVRDESLFMLRFRQLQVSGKRAAGEKRLAYLDAVSPDTELRAHQAREGAASSEGASAGTGESDLRKELGLGESDFEVSEPNALSGRESPASR